MVTRDDLLTLGQAGARLDMSAPTVKVWALEGRLQSERIGGRLFIVREDCERVARQRARAKAARAAKAAREQRVAQPA